MVARQFRVLEAASSSPATSTNRKSRVYPCFFYWSNLVGERSLQAAESHPIFTLLARLDELASGEFGVHPSFARRSRHFDHMKIIRTFSCLEKRSDYLLYLSILILIVRNENSRYHGHLSMVSAFVLLKKTHFYDIINTSKYF